MPTTAFQTSTSPEITSPLSGEDVMSTESPELSSRPREQVSPDNPLVSGLQQAFDDPGDGKGVSFTPMKEYGEARKELTVAHGEEVLNRSNRDTTDKLWLATNGGSEQLSTPKGKEPTAWHEGIRLEEVDGVLTPMMKGTEPQEQRIATAVALGMTNLEEYRKRIVNDFSFGGAMKHFDPEQGGSGEAGFIDSIIARYGPLMADGSPERNRIENLGLEIWSYATLGHDTAGVTNIGQMQGLLYALDSEIATVSDTNTKRTGEMTTVGDTGVEVEQLDGTHGRATILTTRMLMAAAGETQTTITTTDTNPFGGYFATYILTDISSSMGSEIQQFAKLVLFGKGGDRYQISTFHDNEDTLQNAEFSTASAGLIGQYRTLKTSLLGLWQQSQNKPNEANFKAYKDAAWKLNKLSRQLLQFNTQEAYNKLASAGDGQRDPAFNLKEDGQGNVVGDMQESGILNAIERLKEVPPYDPKTLDRVKKFRKQMVVLTDERDSLMDRNSLPDRSAKTVYKATDNAWEKVQLLQNMAFERNMDVQFVFSLQQGGNASTFQIIKADELTRLDLYDMLKGNNTWEYTAKKKNKKVYKWSDVAGD